MSILVPSEAVLNRYCEQAEPLHGRQAANICESEHLATLRDTLLPRLLSGEVRVAEAARTVEAAL